MKERNSFDDFIPNEEENLVKYPYKEKVPVVLLLDTSSSMEGNSIDELNRGLSVFVEELLGDETAKKSVEILIVEFGGYPRVDEKNNFVLAEDFSPRIMKANGRTPMGEAIKLGLEKIQEEKSFLRGNGVNLYRPWLVLITDGYPTDMQENDEKWQATRNAIGKAESEKHCLCWAFGTKSAKFKALKDLFPEKRVLRLEEGSFKDIFLFLSTSLSIITSSKPGDKILTAPLENHGLEVEI